jgi:L-Ala-D/L-Glu epimerase
LCGTRCEAKIARHWGRATSGAPIGSLASRSKIEVVNGELEKAVDVELRRVDWPYVTPFRIAYRVSVVAETVQATLREGDIVGRGEARGVSYRGETVDVLLGQLESIRRVLTNGVSRAQLDSLLPAGGARNAIDCALWDLEAKRSGRRAWELAGLSSVKPLRTAYTLSLDSPDVMGRAAQDMRRYSLLKLKLGGVDDVERVRAVRRARPDAELIVDANQAWNDKQLRDFAPALAEMGVQLIEQPLPAGHDDFLGAFQSPVPLCADESCQTTASLPALAGKYEHINIKLDKTGGLTEALRLAAAARAASFKLMVGCMAGSSLAMAPAFIVGQLCSIVDLDGPLLASSDMSNSIQYDGSQMGVPQSALWG